MAVDHPTTTLEELFLRIVRESDLHPGRRRVGDRPGDAPKPATAVPDEFAGTPRSS
jgi:ABC-2 type transport system ATP-binding protein